MIIFFYFHTFFYLDDENRVVLLDGGSDYMNASYIDVSFSNFLFVRLQ